MVIPAVQRIAPYLSVSRETVRRTTSDLCGTVLFIQLEHFRLCPNIAAIRRHIDRHIANNQNVLIVGIFLQRTPLLIELKLQILLELYFKVQLFAVVVQSRSIVHTDILRPLGPTCSSKEFPQRHKQGVIIQPPEILSAESIECRIFANVATFISLVQQRKTVFIEGFVVYLGRITAKVHRITLFTGQHTFLNQSIQADKIGAASKGRIGLIGRIGCTIVRCTAQGKNLPIFLTGLLQPVHKIIGSFIKAADAIFAGQTGHR